MSDNDLIRRGDAKKTASGLIYNCDYMLGALNAIPAAQPTVKPLVWLDSQQGRYSESRAIGILYSIRLGSDGVTRWQAGHMGPWHEVASIEAAKAAAQADYEARILSALDMQPTVSPDIIEIDIRAVMMERIEEAASQSPWVPPEYAMNEIISDCCSFLREPRDPSPDVAALVDAAEKVINSYWHSTDGVITGIYDLEAALARLKGTPKPITEWHEETGDIMVGEMKGETK